MTIGIVQVEPMKRDNSGMPLQKKVLGGRELETIMLLIWFE